MSGLFDPQPLLLAPEIESISGAETSFVFALPEHRIEKVKYLERVVWDKASRIDYIFGSMNGNGMNRWYHQYLFRLEESSR